MTGADLKAALRELGLTQAEFSRLTGAHLQTVSRWCRGALDVPQYAVTILDQRREIAELTRRAA